MGDPGKVQGRPVVKSISELSDREVGTILAALRYWQRSAYSGRSGLEISEDDALLTAGEIDDLCERINLVDVPKTSVRKPGGRRLSR